MSTVYEGKWFLISHKGKTPSGKTDIYHVEAYSGAMLGKIQWFSAWRGYAFFPERDSVFEAVCLTEIGTFLSSLKSRPERSM